MGNEVVTTSDQPTLSSLDIADYCDKAHKNVMRDIYALREEFPSIQARVREDFYVDSANRRRAALLIDLPLAYAILCRWDFKMSVDVMELCLAQSGELGTGISPSSPAFVRDILEDCKTNRVKVEDKGYVYALLLEDGVVKIGKSTKPYARMQSLASQLHKSIEDFTIFDFKESYHAIEMKAHKHFKSFKTKGEFFNIPYSTACTFLEQALQMQLKETP